MNAIRKILNQKLLSQLEDNIAIKSDKGLVFINGKKGVVTTKETDVATTLSITHDEWVSVVKGSGNLGAMIVDGTVNVEGDIGLAFKLSELIS